MPLSRIYGGIHFDFSNTDGLALGTQVGDWILKVFNLAQDTVPPTVHLDQINGFATNVEPTITGTVTDNLSGVASLTAAIDGGTASAVTVNANGTFTLPLALAFDGSADGLHTVSLVAKDAAGNTASPQTLTFTLDTQAPKVTLNANSVQDNGTLAARAALSGTAISEAALKSLNYKIDGGTVVPLAFDRASGTFNQPLDLTHVTTGNHTLTLTDAAGNVTTDTCVRSSG